MKTQKIVALFALTACFSLNAQSAATENVTNLIARLDPATSSVISNFLKLTDVPRPTYGEKRVSDALVAWAQERGFTPTQDASNNVWFDVPATMGLERLPLTILQGHIDMVAVGFDDPENEIVVIDADADGTLHSLNHKTSTGSDNGIGVGMAMSVAEGVIPHGPVRVVVTTDEERTQTGAKGLDPSVLSAAKHFINIDSETDGEVTISSAANDSLSVTGAVTTASSKLSSTYGICISGFRGGHSGVDIDKGRLNAIVELGHVLTNIAARGISFELAAVAGGDADNAIAPHATAVVRMNGADEAAVAELLGNVRQAYVARGEGDASCSLLATNAAVNVLSADSQAKLLTYLTTVHNGVWSMSSVVPGLVETSVNLGKIEATSEGVRILCAARGSVEAPLQAEEKSIRSTAEACGYAIAVNRSCAPWPANPANPLIGTMTNAWKELTGGTMKVVSLHAGLECGWFAQKAPDLNIVSVGPTIVGPHTVNEKVGIGSVSNCFRLVAQALLTLPKVSHPVVRTDIVDISPYFGEVGFSSYPPAVEFSLSADVVDWLKANPPQSLRKFFACTGGVTNSLVGRNFDWPLDSADEYLVRVPADPSIGRHASVGISAPGVLKDAVTSLLGEEAYLSLVPYAMVDGVNDAGLHISDYIVPDDDFDVATTGTKPDASESLLNFAFVRHALDYSSSVDGVIDMATNINIKAIDGADLELHMLVADTKSSCIIEIVSNKVVVVRDEDKISNFFVSYYRNNPKRYTPHASGIERYDELAKHLGDAESVEKMAELMRSLYYTVSYRAGEELTRWSEVNGDDNACTNDYRTGTGELLAPTVFYHGDTNDLSMAYAARRRHIRSEAASYDKEWEYFNRTGKLMKGDSYVTSHSTVYDLAAKTVLVRSLERETPFRFALADETFANHTGVYVNDDAVGVATNCAVAGSRWTYDAPTKTLTLLDAAQYRVKGDMTGFTVTGAGTAQYANFGTERYPWDIGEGDDEVLAWTNAEGRLVVKGEGRMKGFSPDGSDCPWDVSEVKSVEIAAGVTGIGTNAWVGLSDDVTYNGLDSAAAKTMMDGFGIVQAYVRTPFKGVRIENGVVTLTAALELAPTLTNEWTEVKLKSGDVKVEDGRMVIEHDAKDAQQSFYRIR